MDIKDNALEEREIAETSTEEAFAAGAEFAGVFVQVVVSTALAIAILIAFYVFQRSKNKRI